QKTIRIDFIPTQEDANSTGTIRFVSAEVNAEARLIGYGRSASKLVTEGLSVETVIAQGEPVKKTVTLRNEGKNALIYSIPKLTSGGAEITAAGNFSWESHAQENARPYRFEDISDTGIPVPFANSKDDASALNVPVGFSFPYFGNAFEAVNINYNGFINFSAMPSTTHINRAIPSKDAPKNAIFGMWADIIGASSIRYKSTADCFIVQWTDARFYKSTLTATFQIALFPSGIVELRYSDMLPASGQDIYTIGLQNENGLTGVGVAHKAPYATAQSMTTFYPYTCNAVSAVDKREGVIDPAGSETIELTLDASIDQLTDGVHHSDLLIVTNDPVNAAYHLPITLNVQGQGEMLVAVRNIDFENTLTTVCYEYGLLIRNNGNKAIRVVPQADNQALAFGEFAEGITIAPYGHASLPVYFTPVNIGQFGGTITLVSDQEDNASATVSVASRVTEAPKMSLSRTSLDIRVEAGNEFESDLTVSNHAQTSVLDYTISTPEWLQVIDPAASGEGADSDYGYRWRDNKGANASVVGYSWTDIRTSAEELTMDMTGFYAAFDLPFSFPFYGKEQNRIYISGFGAIAFTAEDATGLNIQSIPVKDKANGLILPLYNAMLQPSLAQSRYYAKAEADRVILQFQNIQTKVGGSVTFQVHLFADGRINCYYNQVENFMYIAQAIVGLEDYNGEKAVVVADKRSYLKDRLALEFYPPTDGSLQPQANKTWKLKVSALDKYEMSANDKILIRSNDPKATVTEIPVSLQVIGRVELEYPAKVDLGYVFVARDNQNQPVAQPFGVTVANRGTKKARITAIALNNMHANLISEVQTKTPMTINEQEEISIDFTLAAKGAANMTDGQLVISFEDGKTATVVLSSKTTLPPVASVSKEFVTWEGMPGDTYAPATITLRNTGSSANGVLNYSVSTRYLGGPHIANQAESMFLNRGKTAEQKLTANEAAVSEAVTYQTSDLIFQDSLFYDQAGIPDDYVGFGSGDFMCANKFTVADKTFRLTHAYNYYYTSYALSGTVTIIKGGTNPDNGKLLVEVPFTQEGTGEVYVALPEAIVFEPGETFWVVFSVKNAPNAQGVNINSRMTDVSYYTNGESWYELTKDSGLSTRPVFKIRAYSIAEEWLDVTPIEGSVMMSQSQDITVSMKRLSLPKPKSYAELVIKTNDPLRREILIPVSVLLNERPVFVETPAEVDRITEGETRHYKFMATDPDGDAVTYGVKDALPQPFSLSVTDGAAYLTLNAEHGTAGIYTVTMTATDGINTPAEFTMVIEVIKINRPPVTTIDEILPIRLTGEPMVIELNDYFSDPDGDDLLYGHQIDDNQPFVIERVLSRLTITPNQIGEGVFTIFCSDGKRSVSKKLPVIVESVNSLGETRKEAMSVYPNPATTYTQITWDADLTVDRLELLTVDGKLIQTVSVAGMNRYQLDLTQVASGYYMVRLMQKDDVIVNKQLIKQ
ncbi:MAG: T9SS type A sorting domain-containing protein, partial [Bacteroidales bacterium]